ncbi:PAS domain-containing sensor histidine kinase [Bacteroides helcogenes]|uniref:histidine kinase n=1 Tax=Bacteroides helcogenes (strain ATCC 35417 / DSM 20613 / JCM 6297 / CCUG 15421 / P 36-108) TaxID=693979 RepID=E6SS76_BACT6|nr:ATP-binding protein [Bacteroides helcogenes]ADV44144.1 multi-sensor signal transduction histidine kinase [Bacteroides helcogenes P 36-108]MDY5238443.1 ATP-binding protein [Bacteroides helcogenes]
MLKKLGNYYLFRVTISLLVTLVSGLMWALAFTEHVYTNGLGNPLFWAVFCTLSLPLVLCWQQKLYRHHIRKVLFMLDAMENDDNAIHFSESEPDIDSRLVNQALNRVTRILYNVKSETAQQEKYYELILDCVNTGVLVLNDNGAVYQKNSEALRLLGLNVFTHINQLTRIDPRLTNILANCRPGDKFQIPFSNERGTVNLSVRVSNITVRKEHLRILALNDINSELDEKEIDSWIRLTRVLTHEIMNAVTPITSLSDTLLNLTASPSSQDEIRSGLQTISSTGKGLLAFIESYRKFTRIPTPEPSLFYVKSFIERMVELARHQHPDVHVTFHTHITPNDLILYADENLISQVLINLLKNAIQAIEADKMPDKEGNIHIRAYCNETEAILIEISNNGLAIPQEIAEHIFIPFFTTKEGGSGIGLSISRQIMRLSGGNISLLPGKETTFILKFN